MEIKNKIEALLFAAGKKVEIEEIGKLVVFWKLIAIIIMFIGAVLIIAKTSKNKYLFYLNKIEFKSRQIPFVNIKNVYLQKNFLDKIFNTGTIILYPDFKIEKISNVNQIFYYIQKLVQRAKLQAVS